MSWFPPFLARSTPSLAYTPCVWQDEAASFVYTIYFGGFFIKRYAIPRKRIIRPDISKKFRNVSFIVCTRSTPSVCLCTCVCILLAALWHFIFTPSLT